MQTQSFLSEFPPVRTEQWEQAIRESLPAAGYESKLIWHPEEGLAIKPFYRAEDLVGLQFLQADPGEFPYVRGTRTSGDWRIREQIEIEDPEEANRVAREAVTAGAEEISFSNVRLASLSDVAMLLANLNEIPIHLEGLKKDSVQVVADRLKNHPHTAGISGDLDPLADPSFAEETIRDAPVGFRPFAIHTEEYHEAGAGSVEEIGFAVSAGVDFLDEMLDDGLPLDRVADSIAFTFAIGPEFFIQIAKLRAFRMVWAKVVESFGGDTPSSKAVVYARTAIWNTTIYDPHVNVLRATTEAMAAVLGGADSVSVAPFDECYKDPEESSRRLARNTQLILKDEAMFTRVADPLGGSYAIEAITGDIATGAWRVFQEIESGGGYRKARAAGVLDSVLDRCTESRNNTVASRRLVLTGTNRFANVAEKAIERVDSTRSSSAVRVARAIEELRFRVEGAERKRRLPSVLLAEIGDAKMRSARSQFAADFLACAGLSSETQRFERVELIAASDADAIVLCSSDPEYLSIAEELMRIMKERGNGTPVLIAGHPEGAERLRELGIWDFIHLRSNAIEVLSRLEGKIGIED